MKAGTMLLNVQLGLHGSCAFDILADSMCSEHVLQHGHSTHAVHMGVQVRSSLAQRWCALFSERDYCSSAWLAAVIGQSLLTSTTFHEGWYDVTQRSAWFARIMCLRSLGQPLLQLWTHFCLLLPCLALRCRIWSTT